MENTKIETWTEQKKRHSDEIAAIPGMFWAFGNDQFRAGMEKLGLTMDDTKLIVSIGSGGYMRRDCVDLLKSALDRQRRERAQLRKDRKRLFDALVYELRNHEYCITYDPADALAAVGITREEIEPEILKKACKLACEGMYV